MADYEPYYRALERETGFCFPAGSLCAFSSGGRRIAVQWDERGGAFLVRVHVGTLPVFGRVEILKRLLAANFLMEGSFGGALDCDLTRDEVGVSFRVCAHGLSPERFVARVRAMRDAASELGAQLEEEVASQELLVRQDLEAAEAELAAEGDAAPSVTLMG